MGFRKFGTVTGEVTGVENPELEEELAPAEALPDAGDDEE